MPSFFVSPANVYVSGDVFPVGFGGGTWGTENNVKASDDNYAEINFGGVGDEPAYISDALLADNFNVAGQLPGYVTSLSGYVYIEKRFNSPDNTIVQDASIILLESNGGYSILPYSYVWASGDTPVSDRTDAYPFFSGLSYSSVASSGFGVIFRAMAQPTGLPDAVFAYVDNISIEFYYTAQISSTGSDQVAPGQLLFPLYLHNAGSPTGSFPIYTSGNGLNSGDFPLFISGVGISSGTFPLYLVSIGSSTGDFPLYVSGIGSSTGSFPLYIAAFGTSSGDFPLILTGRNTATGDFPLYTYGINQSTGVLPLFLLGDSVKSGSGNFPLFTYGNTAGTSGLMGDYPLFLKATNFPNNFPLFLLGREYDSKASGFPLYIQGVGSFIQNNFPLYIVGPTGVTSNFPLYLGGLSTSLSIDDVDPAGLNATGSFPLFLARIPAEKFPLYLACNLVNSGQFPLYMFGASGISSDFPLFLYTGYDTDLNTFNIVTRGF